MSEKKKFKLSNKELSVIGIGNLNEYLEIIDRMNNYKNTRILYAIHDKVNFFLESRKITTVTDKLEHIWNEEGWKRPSVKEVTWECCFMPCIDNFLIESHELDTSVYKYGTADTNDYDDEWHFIPKYKCDYSEDLYFKIYVSEDDYIISEITYNNFINADQYGKIRDLSGNEVIRHSYEMEKGHGKFYSTFGLKILAEIFVNLEMLEKIAINDENFYRSKIFIERN